MKKSEFIQVYNGFTIVVKKTSPESQEGDGWSRSWKTTTIGFFSYSIPGKVNGEVSGHKNANSAFKAAMRKIDSF